MTRPWNRESGALEVDLGELSAADVDRIEVGWPTSRLRDLTILDTPGIASISADISARTHRVLAADDGRVPVADAVLYLMRHTHASDVRFLESFHDDELAHGTPMNSVGVLSRADEIGVLPAGRHGGRRPDRARATRPTHGCAGCARSCSRSTGCWPTRRPRCGRRSTPCWPRWPGRRARRPTSCC